MRENELPTLQKFKTYRENPFMKDAMQYIKEKNSKVGIAKAGTLHIINKATGEVSEGQAVIYTRKHVDDQQFVKLYLNNIKVLFGLKNRGLRILCYFAHSARRAADVATFNLEDCKRFCEYTSPATVYKGLAELLDAGIIARCIEPSHFYLNPSIIFNGDRVRIISDYIRSSNKIT